MALVAKKLPKESRDKCHFCKSHIDDPPLLGDKFRIKDVNTHYYCVLLSNGATQRGKDDEGLCGFLYADIKRELQRAKYVKCSYCHEFGAAMQCSKCDHKFHLTCGVVRNIASHFKDDFRSYCAGHRPRQTIPDECMEEARTPPLCVVCQEQVHVWEPQPPRYEDPLFQAIWAPCCKKTWYHRKCIQGLALSQASLFKCAVCSNVDKFRKWVIKYGVYIPERDASWELEEPERFNALLERYNRCDAEECKYPQGREDEQEGTMWEILVCSTCGSRGTHKRCSGVRMLATEWECPDCLKILSASTGTGERDRVLRSPSDSVTSGSVSPTPPPPPPEEIPNYEGTTTENDSDRPIVPPPTRKGNNRARRGRRIGPKSRTRQPSSSANSSSSSERRVGRKRRHEEISSPGATKSSTDSEHDVENTSPRKNRAKRRVTRRSSSESSDTLLDVVNAATGDESESVPLAKLVKEATKEKPVEKKVKKVDQWSDARKRVDKQRPSSSSSSEDVREIAPPAKTMAAVKTEPSARGEPTPTNITISCPSAPQEQTPTKSAISYPWIVCQETVYEVKNSPDGNIQLINRGRCLIVDSPSPLKMAGLLAMQAQPGPSFQSPSQVPALPVVNLEPPPPYPLKLEMPSPVHGRSQRESSALGTSSFPVDEAATRGSLLSQAPERHRPPPPYEGLASFAQSAPVQKVPRGSLPPGEPAERQSFPEVRPEPLIGNRTPYRSTPTQVQLHQNQPIRSPLKVRSPAMLHGSVTPEQSRVASQPRTAQNAPRQIFEVTKPADQRQRIISMGGIRASQSSQQQTPIDPNPNQSYHEESLNPPYMTVFGTDGRVKRFPVAPQVEEPAQFTDGVATVGTRNLYPLALGEEPATPQFMAVACADGVKRFITSPAVEEPTGTPYMTVSSVVGADGVRKRYLPTAPVRPSNAASGTMDRHGFPVISDVRSVASTTMHRSGPSRNTQSIKLIDLQKTAQASLEEDEEVTRLSDREVRTPPYLNKPDKETVDISSDETSNMETLKKKKKKNKKNKKKKKKEDDITFLEEKTPEKILPSNDTTSPSPSRERLVIDLE